MQRSLEKDLAILEITFHQALAKVPDSDPDVWAKRTEAFHELVRSARKAQCKKWHPDVCSAPDAVERCAEINAAADGLLTITISPPRPQPVMRVVFGGWSVVVNNVSSTLWATTTEF